MRGWILKSGFQLPTNLARFVFGTVDIHIQIAGLETGVLVIRELRACGDGPRTIGAFVERNDGRPALSWRSYVNMRHRPFDAHSLNGAGHGFVRSDCDRAGPGR